MSDYTEIRRALIVICEGLGVEPTEWNVELAWDVLREAREEFDVE